MIRINLLPHREEKRRQRKNAFFAMLVVALVLGGVVVLLVAGFIASNISNQEARNSFIKAENARLDAQIAEIATLKQEIDALRARQQAVEDLQSDRNQPVFLMDELAKQVPEGIYLRSFKQSGQRVVLNGVAQSNERVSELLRNLSNSSPWLERPDLIEIRSAPQGGKQVYDFTINVGIKRPRDKEQAAAKSAVASTGTTTGLAPNALGAASAGTGTGAVAPASAGTTSTGTTTSTAASPAKPAAVPAAAPAAAASAAAVKKP
jgi:type IV pilus assembly protein PilN